ncbi:MAG TPA: TIGR02444 family protein [Stellaceae bacterium]|nr:TIGR02444 family protein [Stellaceae bacterium]
MRGDSFWSFTLAFYGREGVSPALIALQDRFGHDVNLLLYACWLGLHEGVALTVAERTAAAERVQGWREGVLIPLRSARRAIKAAAVAQTESVYSAAKTLEISAEQVGQRLMAEGAPAARAGVALAERRRLAAANLELCLSSADERGLAAPIAAALAAVVAP